jgi:hypothetical protein
MAQKNLKFHAWVKKCHFGYFSYISQLAGLAMPCQCSPQKVIVAIEKFFLFWAPMNI